MIRIIYERSGGFMGRLIRLELTLDELPHDQSQTLQHLLDETDFFHLETPPNEPAADGFQHAITVEDGPLSRSISFGEGNIPGKLRPLLEELKLLSRTRA